MPWLLLANPSPAFEGQLSGNTPIDKRFFGCLEGVAPSPPAINENRGDQESAEAASRADAGDAQCRQYTYAECQAIGEKYIEYSAEKQVPKWCYDVADSAQRRPQHHVDR